MSAVNNAMPKTKTQRLQDKNRRSTVIHSLVTVTVLALLLGFALLVGDKSYHASIVGWMPFFSALTLIVCDFAYVKIVARCVESSDACLHDHCDRGQKVPFRVTFKNTAPLPAFHIDTFFYLGEREGKRFSEIPTTLSLSPFETYDMSLNVRFEHVGTYWAGLDRIIVHDFLGLFKTTITHNDRQCVRVSPCIHRIDSLPLESDTPSEASASMKATLADSLDYSHVREYATGDPLKTVHWKLSARGAGKLFTRLYEVYSNPTVAVFAGFYADTDNHEDLLFAYDTVVECALSAMEYAIRAGYDSQLLFVDRNGEERRVPAWASSSYEELLEDFPPMDNNVTLSHRAIAQIVAESSSVSGQSNMVICTADLGNDLISAVLGAKINRRNPFVFAIVPKSLAGRERDNYCANLALLDNAGISYLLLSDSSLLSGVR